MAGGDLEAAVRLAAGAAGPCAGGVDCVGAAASLAGSVGGVGGGGGAGGGREVAGRPEGLQERKRRQQAAAAGGGEEDEEEGKRRATTARAHETSMWKVAAILLARSYRSGYAK